jgi:peptide deformylase
MMCFVPLDDDTLMKLWALNPRLVSPFSRPFWSSSEGCVSEQKQDAHVRTYQQLKRAETESKPVQVQQNQI